MKRSTSILLFSLLLSFLSLDFVLGHSYLTVPRPRSSQSGGCRIGGPPQFPINCPGPCETIGRISTAISVTYQRGQKANVRWSRNNHENGFVRWTVVKKSDMMDREAHDKGTFAYSCWSNGRGPCQDRFECGSDRQNQSFSDTIEIPTIYPDGEYILGWVWFGGQGTLGEYYSCANIAIKGGPLAQTYAPVNNTCLSTSDHVGTCISEPCPNRGRPSIMRVPKRFQNGPPPLLKSSDYASDPAAPTTKAAEPTTTKPTTKAPQPTTPKPTTKAPQPTTTKPTTKAPQPTTPKPTTQKPTTPKPTTKTPTGVTVAENDKGEVVISFQTSEKINYIYSPFGTKTFVVCSGEGACSYNDKNVDAYKGRKNYVFVIGFSTTTGYSEWSAPALLKA